MKQTVVVFISLLIDLLAFTLILPLFPKIFDHYNSNTDDFAYHFLQNGVNEFRNMISVPDGNNFNSVLFGGLIGSLFSFLQFVSSTIIGAASDSYGRKPVLLFVLFGTLVSYLAWSISSVFVIFLISRIIGGISKANVSLCIAIMTDLSDKNSRSSAMALVGIAFSLGFLFGPSIGAVFSSKLSSSASAIYAYPSYLAITLTLINIIFVAKFYKESLPKEKRSSTSFKKNFSQSLQFINPVCLFKFTPIKSLNDSDLSVLRRIGFSNFLYLFLYSGLEFTLTFLVHNRFNYDSIQQGKMFLFIGICMTVIQGGYVRRIKNGKHLKAAIFAILLLIPAFIIIGFARDQLIFYVGLFLYCYSSAVVVQCFTTMISNYGKDDEKGTVTGISRSLTALARAFGPTFSSIVYWTYGPLFAYTLGACGLCIPLCILVRLDNTKVKSF